MIHDKFPDYIQILCTVIFSDPAIILVKNSVQHPEKVVFNAPVCPHGFRGELYIFQALCAAVDDEGTSGNYPAWE